MPDDTPAGSAPALGFSITANIHGSAQIVAQSFVPFESNDDQINAALDKVMKAIDRQQAKYQVKDLKKKLEQEEMILVDQVQKAENLQNAALAEHKSLVDDGKRRGPFKYNQQQEAAISNAKKTIEGMKFNVERYKVNIAELEALAR